MRSTVSKHLNMLARAQKPSPDEPCPPMRSRKLVLAQAEPSADLAGAVYTRWACIPRGGFLAACIRARSLELRISSAGEFCLFSRGPFSLFGRFLSVLDNFDSFWVLIFLFLSFFRSRDTSHKQTDVEAVLLPIQKRLSSGPIGPLRLPFLFLWIWDLNRWFPCVESSLSTRRRCSQDSWDPLSVLTTRVREGGDPGGPPPLFSLYFGLPSE
jgi:hypothetical protein